LSRDAQRQLLVEAVRVLCFLSSKMPCSVKERVNIVEAYVRTGSFKETREIFHEQFPDASVPAKSTLQNLIAKWRAIGSVFNAKPNRLPSVRTPEAVANIQQRILVSPNKCVRKLSQQSGLKRTSCDRVLQSLHLKPYRVSCV
jgi:hypothetical protein